MHKHRRFGLIKATYFLKMSHFDCTSEEAGKYIAEILEAEGFKVCFGCPGVPITKSLKYLNERIPVIIHKNEQCGSHAAACFGYLSGTYCYEALPVSRVMSSLGSSSVFRIPSRELEEEILGYRPGCGSAGLLFTSSGPGFINALSGISTAYSNCWPLVICTSSNRGSRENFQYFPDILPDLKTRKIVKEVFYVEYLNQFQQAVRSAHRMTLMGTPGVVVIDICWAVFHEKPDLVKLDSAIPISIPRWDCGAIDGLLDEAKKPLLILGKGLAYSIGERGTYIIKNLPVRIPMIPTPMGKGLIADDDFRNAQASRSKALSQSDFIIFLGCRNQWKFNKSISTRNIVEVIHDPESSNFLSKSDSFLSLLKISDTFRPNNDTEEWLSEFQPSSGASRFKTDDTVDSKIRRRHQGGITYGEAFSQLNDKIEVWKIKGGDQRIEIWAGNGLTYVAEGGHVMDLSRLYLTINLAKARLDAGSFGTMGIGVAFGVANCVYSKDVFAVKYELF